MGLDAEHIGPVEQVFVGVRIVRLHTLNKFELTHHDGSHRMTLRRDEMDGCSNGSPDCL
jgi:hypothetical protein